MKKIIFAIIAFVITFNADAQTQIRRAKVLTGTEKFTITQSSGGKDSASILRADSLRNFAKRGVSAEPSYYKSGTDSLKIAPSNITLTTNTGSAVFDSTYQRFNGYKSYEAQVTQTSTSAPVATVRYSGFTQALNWARSGVGIYTITAASGTPFTAGKTVVDISTILSGLHIYSVFVTSTSVITIHTAVLTAGAAVDTDALFIANLVSIRVYN